MALVSIYEGVDRPHTFHRDDHYVYTSHHGIVVIYDGDNGDSWLACQNAPRLHDWR